VLTRLVEEAVQWVEAEAALAVRRSTLLLGVALQQLRVEIERDRLRARPQRPGPLAGTAACGADRRQLVLAERVQQPCGGRVRRDAAEQVRLLGKRAQIRDAVAAIDQHRRQINHHSPRVVQRAPLEQAPEPGRELTLEPQPGRQLGHQRQASTRHEALPISSDLKRSEPAARLHSQGASSLCGM
jgi:hypothetical protein